MPDKKPRTHKQEDAPADIETRDNPRHDQKPKHSADTAKQKKSKNDVFLRWASFIVDVLVFFAVSIYSAIAYQQWSEMRLDRRAWVAVAETKGSVEVGKPLLVHVSITNTGRTFARNVDFVAAGEPVAANEIPDFAKGVRERAKLRSNGNPDDVSHMLMAPNARTEASVEQRDGPSVPLPEGAFKILKEGSQRFFLYGEITYDDIFDHHHWLTFCSVLHYNPLDPENGGWSYVYYSKYNDTGDGDPPWKY